MSTDASFTPSRGDYRLPDDMVRIIEDTSVFSLESYLRNSLYVEVSWCFWHEGLRAYDDSYPGSLRNIVELREGMLLLQHHNGYATNLISRSSLEKLRAAVYETEVRLEAERRMQENFAWVLYHEGQKGHFLDLYQRGDYSGIRREYHNYQSHNPNARSLLSCVSNYYISRLMETL